MGYDEVLHRSANSMLLLIIFATMKLPQEMGAVGLLNDVMLVGAAVLAGYVVIEGLFYTTKQRKQDAISDA